jgi:hypothetical protein
MTALPAQPFAPSDHVVSRHPVAPAPTPIPAGPAPATPQITPEPDATPVTSAPVEQPDVDVPEPAQRKFARGGRADVPEQN